MAKKANKEDEINKVSLKRSIIETYPAITAKDYFSPRKKITTVKRLHDRFQ